MANSFIAIDEPAVTDKKLDTEQLTVGANTVERERVQIAGAAAAEIAPVSATDGLLVNLGANNDITGTVTANVSDNATRDNGKIDVASLDQYTPVSGRLPVDGSGVTQPVSNAGLTALNGAIAGTEVQVDVLTLPNVTLAAGTNTNEVVGDAAHGAAQSGNPIQNGGTAETSPAGVTVVTDGQATRLYAGADGILYVRPYCALEDILSGVDTDTAGDSTSVIAAQGAGIRIYVTSVIVKNAHASTDAYVDIRDGVAGTVLASIPAPAAGGAVVSFPVPLRLTANTACCVHPSAAVTTIKTTVVGFKAAV